MKIGIQVVFILIWAISTFAQAGVAKDISRPVFTDMRFSVDSIALITERETYILSTKGGFARSYKGSLGNNFLPTSKSKQERRRSERPNGNSMGVIDWVTENGTKFQSVEAYCGEGAEEYHALFYKTKELNTYLPNCESISDLLLIGSDELWLGSTEQHEYSIGAGSGVRVISLKSKKLIAAFSPKEKSMDGYVMPLNFDAASGKLSAVKKAPVGRIKSGKLIAQSRGQLADGYVKFIRRGTTASEVWVLTQTALHRISNKKVVGRWYISEQFSTEGEVTIVASLKPVKSNPWVILLRQTKAVNPKSIWQQLQKSPKLAKRLTYAYDEDGRYFSIDGKQMSEYATVEDKRSTMIMWDYNLSNLEYAQELINRLNTKGLRKQTQSKRILPK